MKNKNLISISLLFLSFFAINAEEAESKSTFIENLKLSISVDGAYYPESEYKSSSTHMSKLTGAYHSLEGRITFSADYTIKTPLGEHWLLKDANLNLNGGFEVSPITIRPKISASFTPLPFLEFSAGASVGTGWTLFGWEGMSILNTEKVEYENLTPFKHYYYDFWFQGTFQFDTGAIIPGEWSHVLFAASYKVLYTALSGIANNEIWEWQASDNNANGLQYYTSLIIAYQMPKLVKRVGIMYEMEGHYKDSDYVNLGGNFKGDFGMVSISPLAQLKFTEKDSLIIMASLSSRRAFKEEHEKTVVEPYLNYVGYEWYFRRIALSYTHKF